MKNNILFMLITGSIILFSCGTANRASYASSDFVNGIYYVPDQNEVETYTKHKNELNNLQNETSQYLNNRSRGLSYNSSKNTQTIFVGDTNVVNIDYNPNYTYAIQDDSLSYMNRLLKYDSPTYNINIEWNFPYTDFYDGWYRPYWASVGTAWYNPYWGLHYSWWGPSFAWNRWHGWYGWYDPWYTGGWYGPWYAGGWYDPWYPGGWYDPWWGFPPHYGPGPGPGHHHHRDIYYGQRNSRPTYQSVPGGSNNRGGSYARRDANMSQIRGNRTNPATQDVMTSSPSQSRPSYSRSGSAYRRGGNSTHNGAIYNNGAIDAGNYNPHGVKANDAPKPTNNGGSMYRRSSTQHPSQTVRAQSSNNEQQYNNQRSNSNNSYYRNSNSSNYNRNNSSYSSGSNSYRSGSSMSTGNSRRSGSSYRR